MKIVITGCSSGIGRRLSSYLSNKHKIFGISRKKITTKKFKSFSCYILKIEQIQDTFKKIKNFDVLINCAGISHFSTDKIINFDQIIKTNLNAPFHTSSAAVNFIKNSSNPSIINISSINGHLAFPNNPGYIASKGGLISLTRSLAYDLAKYKIRVNCVSPGYIKEGMTLKSYNDPKKRIKRQNRTMLKRWGKVEDLFGIIDYLISNKSKYVTSQDFIVDGGWTFKGI